MLVPPLLALAVEALAGLAGRRLGAVLHLLFVALLVALIAIQALNDNASSAGSAVLMAAAATLALAAVVGYARLSGLRSFVTVLSPAPAVFLANFLFFSPMSDLAFASGSAETADVSSRLPVVMVVFDEVSTIAFEDGRERIDPVLYPNLAALARDGTLVPLRDGADRHDRHGNPDHPDRHRRQAAPPADPLEPSAQTCSPARPPLPATG